MEPANTEQGIMNAEDGIKESFYIHYSLFGVRFIRTILCV